MLLSCQTFENANNRAASVCMCALMSRSDRRVHEWAWVQCKEWNDDWTDQIEQATHIENRCKTIFALPIRAHLCVCTRTSIKRKRHLALKWNWAVSRACSMQREWCQFKFLYIAFSSSIYIWLRCMYVCAMQTTAIMNKTKMKINSGFS